MADVRKILWKNLEALMTERWKEVNISRLGRESEIGPSGAHRIKEQHQSSGIVLVEQLAKLFDLEAWQLLHPEMGKLSGDAMDVAVLFDRIPKELQGQAYAVISALENIGRVAAPDPRPSDDQAPPPETPPAAAPAARPTKRARAKAPAHRQARSRR